MSQNKVIYTTERPISLSYNTEISYSTTMKIHKHKEFEIYYLLKGQRKLCFEDKSCIIKAGEGVLIPPKKVHYTQPVGDEQHCRIVLLFNKNYINDLIKEITEVDLISIFYPNEKVIGFPTSKRHKLELLFYEMEKEFKSKTLGYHVSLKLHLMEILLLLVRSKPYIKKYDYTTKKLGRKVNYMEEMVQFIDENYADPITLTVLAEKFYMNPASLSRSFKRYTNKNFIDYLNEKRIDEAKRLLEKTNLTITEIAVKSGYSSTSYFEKNFKKLMKMTPSMYRGTYNM